ncbi:GNAT family N-acetyltransferase [Agrilactobacillus yilanensis]|uniref:GNAT family N-acetyltransferase n=1 Tax=Agrilactobacillus yilanensis TaxID=2485997 RepID=A0ABW4J6K0_9LACO|nr:GNAT family N-acetyltransferase [Agrilactobacillus yilanensis]
MLKIDTAQIVQADEIKKLLNEAYAADKKIGIYFKAADVTTQQVRQHIQTTPTFVLSQDSKIIGTISVRLPWSANPGPYPCPHLGWIAVAPKYQGLGYAKQLIQWAEQHYVLEVLKAPGVTLGTAYEHPWLKRTYFKLGYHPLVIVDKFPDHRTLYLMKIFDEARLKAKMAPQVTQYYQHEILIS